MINLKCKKCGNEEMFYQKEKVKGEIIVKLDSNGDFLEDGENSEMYDHLESNLKSVYYYCIECDNKVSKIPEDRRF